MKKILLYLSVFAFSAAGLSSCADDYDEYDNSWFLENDETMTLSASVSSLELIEDTPLDEQVLTFTWTPARQMPDEYVVTYVTQLDLKSNNFASSTVIREVENDGVFSKSYTTEQLQSYITDKWGQSIADVSTVSFKVIAKWDGGTQYVMPEVRTVDVDIQPYKPLVFEADQVFVSGSAKTGTSRQAVSQTLEDEYLYAIVTNLKPGELIIPVVNDGVEQYIAPALDQDGTFKDGVDVPARMLAQNEDGSVPEDAAWEITETGDHRIVINMLDQTVKIYSPDNEFNKPFTVEWYPNCTLTLTPYPVTVTSKVWIRGDGAYKPDGTGSWYEYGVELNLQQSEADPMVLVYSGPAIKSGRNSFAITSAVSYDANGDGKDESYTCNNAYVFAPVRVDTDGNGYHDGQGVDINKNGITSDKGDTEDGIYNKDANHDESVTVGAWMDMSGGPDIRGNYFKTPSGANFIVFDLRNMKIKFEVR